MKRAKQTLIGISKYLIAAGLLWLALSKIDKEQLLNSLSSMTQAWLLPAFIALNLAQVVSSFRMRHYFKKYGLKLNKAYCVMLYYVGMFYNNVLPGGVGGDGYKVIVVNRIKHFPAKKAIKLLISERGNGLASLLFLLFALGLSSIDLENILPYKNLLMITGLAGIFPAYLITVRILFGEDPKVGMVGALFSFPVQLIFMASAVFIFLGLGIQADMNEYLILYLIASVLAAVLPISVGGVGIRELTFIQGSTLFGLDATKGVAFALLFYLVYFASSLVGLLFLNKIKVSHTHFHQ